MNIKNYDGEQINVKVEDVSVVFEGEIRNEFVSLDSDGNVTESPEVSWPMARGTVMVGGKESAFEVFDNNGLNNEADCYDELSFRVYLCGKNGTPEDDDFTHVYTDVDSEWSDFYLDIEEAISQDEKVNKVIDELKSLSLGLDIDREVMIDEAVAEFEQAREEEEEEEEEEGIV